MLKQFMLLAFLLLINSSVAWPGPAPTEGYHCPSTKTISKTTTKSITVTSHATQRVTKTTTRTIVKGSTKTVTTTKTAAAKTDTITKSTTVTKPTTLTVTKTTTAPTCKLPTVESFTMDYNFDTEDGGDPVLATSNIGTYNDLQWDMARVDLVDNGAIAGVSAESGTWVAGFSGFTKVTTTPKVTIVYPSSTIAYFNAQSMYFACVKSTLETLVSLPTSCTITATGYDTTGKAVGTQTFDYAPGGVSNQAMTKGTFNPSFANLVRIEFSVTNDVFDAALIDNFVATLYQPIKTSSE